MRGDLADYDSWGALVNDKRWTYDGLLPYFRKTEKFFTKDTDPKEHGFEGPIYVQSVSSAGRVYSLRQRVKELWSPIGINETVKSSSGVLPAQSLRENLESWHEGRRQVASTAYSLRGVEVMTETLAERILFEDNNGLPSAEALQLSDGRSFKCRREIIIAAGAYRTPQLLCLSGIGPANLLREHGISVILDQPAVGQNFHDHLAVNLFWKLKDTTASLAAGSANFSHPSHSKGLPLDFIVYQTLPSAVLLPALQADEASTTESHPLVSPPRSHLEYYFVYAGANADKPKVPLDGTHVMTGAVRYLPTSRGTMSIASANPSDFPVIDNNYYATIFDRTVL